MIATKLNITPSQPEAPIDHSQYPRHNRQSIAEKNKRIVTSLTELVDESWDRNIDRWPEAR